jgi:hypothetical protein
MSSQLDQRLGVGETFETLNPQQIADAVRRVLSCLPSKKREAMDASGRAWKRHESRAVLDMILAPQGAAA